MAKKPNKLKTLRTDFKQVWTNEQEAQLLLRKLMMMLMIRHFNNNTLPSL